MGEIDGHVGALLERLLDAATRRQALIAANIANLDTPGYRTRDLDFERVMAAAERGDAAAALDFERTAPGHLGGGGKISPDGFEIAPEGLVTRNDLNNVSIDREMLALAWTAGRYSTAIELLRKRIALLRYAITDGRSGGA